MSGARTASARSKSATPKKPKRPRTQRQARPAEQKPPPSRPARQLAAAILEVLAGVRTPSEAAEAVGVSVTRYYQLETRALQGLVAACEPRPSGPQRRTPEKEVERLTKELERMRRECMRSQALLRQSQRTIGLAAKKDGTRAKGKKAGNGRKSGGKPRVRKPRKRALKAVAALRREDVGESPGNGAADLPSAGPTE